jgi:serine/threonine-protein kinase
LRKPPKPTAGGGATTGATQGTPTTTAPTADPAQEQRTVTVSVTPAQAAVEVDGARVEPGPNGEVKVTGLLGSKHRVRVTSGAADSTTDVIIGLEGAVPEKIALAPPPPPASASTSAVAQVSPVRDPHGHKPVAVTRPLPTTPPTAAPPKPTGSAEVKEVRVFE